jgi:signal transduction histidine kinase
MHIRFPKLTFDALLSAFLLYLILVSYVVLLYAIIFELLVAMRLLVRESPELTFVPPWWVGLVCIIVTTPTLPPVHRWLRGNINDIIYGQHDDPYALIAEINAHLQAMSSPQSVLPTVVKSIGRILKVPYVAITAEYSNTPLHMEFGSKVRQSEVATFPLLYLEKPLGELVVGVRQVNGALSAWDRELLEDVARQIGIALYAVQLSADLQASRERIVISREEERRRIRNDLHDGLGPTLSALQLQLGALRNLIREKPEEAEAIASELRADLRQATSEIRQLVYDLRPPLLDELGLVEAIKAIRLQGAEVSLEVSAPETMPKLSAALEVAIYRIASEAIHNVICHAEATRCLVCLELKGRTLKLVISDNGKSLPEAPTAGVGFASMKERAAELGGTLSIASGAQGGVEVAAYFPIV